MNEKSNDYNITYQTTIIGLLIIILLIATIMGTACFAMLSKIEDALERQELQRTSITLDDISISPKKAVLDDPIIIEEPTEERIEEVNDSFYLESVPLDYETQADLYSACEEFNVPYEMALAVIFVETNYQNVRGDGGNSEGYMQIQPYWVMDIMEKLEAHDLMTPKDNFRVGCYLLHDFIEDYGIPGAFTRYNAGHGGTSEYAERVIDKWEELRNG